MLSWDYVLRRALKFVVTRQLGPLLKSKVRERGGGPRPQPAACASRPRHRCRVTLLCVVRTRWLGTGSLFSHVSPTPSHPQVDADSLSVALADGAATLRDVLFDADALDALLVRRRRGWRGGGGVR